MIKESLFKLTHEIKNPIAVCKGYLDMLDLDDKKTSKKYIDTVKKEIERTLVIMDDFLDYTKIKVTKNIMDVNYLVEDTIDSMNSLFEKKDIDVNTELYDDEVFIEGDFNRLKQVIVNIVKNSMEARKDNDKLSLDIVTKLENGEFSVSITDNGVGMDMSELNNIGKSFYTTKTKGTGLGVLLSKEIIELHEGNIVYESEKGSGTTVTISFPVLKDME